MNLYSTRAATVVALIQLTLYMNGQLLNHEVWKRVRDCMLCYSTKTVPLFVIRTKMLQHYDSTKEVDSSYIEVYCVGTDDSYQ